MALGKMRKKPIWLFLVILILLSAGGTVLAGSSQPGDPPVPQYLPPHHQLQNPGAQVYLPAVFAPPELLPWVNTQDQATVRAYYLDVYLSSDGVSPGWTGSRKSCAPGTTSIAFKDAILRRINFFRAMSGIPAVIGFKEDHNTRAQAAALMMSVNGKLSHNPDPSWECYSAAGDEGAGSSNLYLGVYGPSAISGYIYDPGAGNYPVGHRRWILHPKTQYMGTGDIPPASGEWSANALWVFDSSTWGTRPKTRDTYVAWPPPGFVPRQVIYPRWSFSYPGADFSATAISVKRGGSQVSVTISPIVNGYGENTIVWELGESLPSGDFTYFVSVKQVKIDGIQQDFTYEVKGFDPTR